MDAVCSGLFAGTCLSKRERSLQWLPAVTNQPKAGERSRLEISCFFFSKNKKQKKQKTVVDESLPCIMHACAAENKEQTGHPPLPVRGLLLEKQAGQQKSVSVCIRKEE